MFKCKLTNLLLEDNKEITLQRINYYVNEITTTLKSCKITQKSINEIYLHEFKTPKYYILSFNIIYNGDFEESFRFYYTR